MTKQTKHIGYKAFDKDLKCRNFQYEIGKTYKEKSAKLCANGFHYCENPIDVFNYYPPTSRFALVEASGIDKKTDTDSKRAAKTITITTELSLHALIDAAVKFTFSKIDWKNNKETNTGNQSVATNTGYQSVATNTGDQSAATNTGDQSAATNTGNQSAATNTGNQSAATNTGYQSVATNTGYQSVATNTGDHSVAAVSGKESIAIVIGIDSQAKGAKGCWLVIAEYEELPTRYRLVSVKSVKVDGVKIKADTFYKLVGGEFIEA